MVAVRIAGSQMISGIERQRACYPRRSKEGPCLLQRIYFQLNPHACRVQPVQAEYSTLTDYLNTEFLNHL